MTPSISLERGKEPGERILNLSITVNPGEAIQISGLLDELGWEEESLHIEKTIPQMEREETAASERNCCLDPFCPVWGDEYLEEAQ